MNIAVVILNWNGITLLEQFLPSIVKHSNKANIYVADNASTDDSVEFVKTNYPTIKIIQNKENFGFAKGYNEALKHINEDIFCILNNDVEVTHDWLNSVTKIFKSESNTVVIQPKILDYKRKDYFEYAGAAGGFIDKYGYPYCRGRIFKTVEKDEGQYNGSKKIFWASGACLFIKKEIFNSLNGFDESFFAHMEEIDLCWRIHNLGYDIKYTGQSTIYHVGGATLQNTNPEKTFLNFRNSLYTLTKNAKGTVFLLILMRLLLDGVAGANLLFQLKPIHTLAIIKSHFSFYKHLPRVLKQRKTSLSRRKYYNKTSIVSLYFLNKKRTFNSL